MEIEWSVTSVTAAGSPVRAGSEKYWVILGILRPIQAAIVVGEPLCDLGIPS